MVSKLAFLYNLLLASAALAAPSSRLGDRLARHREGHQSQPLKLVEGSSDAVFDTGNSSNWAGAIVQGGDGTFTSAIATFTIPVPSGNGAASAWTGIDGVACRTALLQTGIQLTISNDGQISYSAWYEWYPDHAYYFTGINLSAGDTVQISVTAYSMTSGVAVIKNFSTGQVVQQQLSSSYALCGRSAEWIVEDFVMNDSLVPFVDFGTVAFRSASASGPNGFYTPSEGTIVNIEQNNQVLTSASTFRENVVISYVTERTSESQSLSR